MMERRQRGSGDGHRCDALAASGRTASASPWALVSFYATDLSNSSFKTPTGLSPKIQHTHINDANSTLIVNTRNKITVKNTYLNPAAALGHALAGSVDEHRPPAREVDVVDAEERRAPKVVVPHVMVHHHVPAAHRVEEQALAAGRVDVVVRPQDDRARGRAVRDRDAVLVDEGAGPGGAAPDAHLVLRSGRGARLRLRAAGEREHMRKTRAKRGGERDVHRAGA